MRKVSSLPKNTLYSATSSISNILLLILVMIAARVLGDQSFGRFSFALAVVSIFERVTDLGLNTLTARNVARDKSMTKIYLPNIIAWKTFLSVTAFGLFIIAVKFLSRDAETRTAAYIIGFTLILQSYKSIAITFFQAYERFDMVLLIVYTERISIFLLSAFVLIFVGGLIPFVLVFTFSRVPDLIFSSWLVHKRIAPLRVEFQAEVIKNLQKSAMPLGIYALVLSVYWSTSTIILSAMRPASEVGWYNAGYKIYESFTMVPFLLCTVLLPRLSRLFISNRRRHTDLTLKAIRYLLLISVPLAVSIGVLSPQIIKLLYGATYLPAVPALRILLGASAFMFVNWILSTVLISADREKVIVWVTAAGLLMITTASLFFIHQYGYIGAAYSVAISEVFIFLLLLACAKRELFSVPAHVVAWRPAAAGTAAWFALHLSPHIKPAPLVVLFILLYVVLLVALRTFGAEEWAVVKSIFSSGARSRA